MIRQILGTKIRETHVFTENGNRIPVTEIQAGPCFVTRIISEGYKGVQIGYRFTRRISKPVAGQLKKAGLEDKKLKHFREVRTAEVPENVTVGMEVNIADVVAPGDRVSVLGTSKGKGFAGVVKRHNFRGGPRTHGQSDRERAPGSIGQTTTPGRVYKGKRMAGRMGTETVKIRNLRVVEVSRERNTLVVKGTVPGAKTGLLIIEKIS